MILSSIRSRIQVWNTLLLAAIVGSLLVAFYYHEKKILTQALDRELADVIVPFLAHYEPVSGLGGRSLSPRPTSPGERTVQRSEGMRPPRHPRKTLEEKKADLVASGSYLIVWDREGEVDRTENAPMDRSRPVFVSMKQPFYNRSVDDYREYVHHTLSGRVLVFGRSLTVLTRRLNVLGVELFGIWLGVILLGFGVGWAMITKSLKPIRSISESAREIARGDLSRRIDNRDTESELGQLVEVLNETFEQLENSFDQQRRFTADASHELRTPISVILAKCQFALMRERSPEKYREALQICEGTAQHLRSLIESLLDLARVDSGQFHIQKRNCNLGEVARKGVDLLRTLAERKEIELHVEFTDIACFVDCQRIQQVLTNLLGNAIKFTQEGGQVSLTVKRLGEEALIEVADNGPGISEEALPHVFDRFYRAESVHADERKSTGLGLSIARVIVEAHEGSIRVESKPGRGTCFQVHLPLLQEC